MDHNSHDESALLLNGNRSVDGLKRSLEDAIKEMQDIPAATQPVTRQDEDLRLARAADTLQSMRPMPQASVTEQPANPLNHANPLNSGQAAPPPVQAAPPAPDFIPATNSIEAALSSAPAVSAHYVPPEPVVAPVAPPAAPLVASMSASPAPQKPVSQKPAPAKRRALRFGTPEKSHSAPMQPALKITAAFPNSQSGGKSPAAPGEPVGSEGLGLADLGDLAADAVLKAKKQRENIWRWATIGVSCAGGLASGWLGSNITNQNNGIFQASLQTIVGKTSNSGSSLPPANVKIVPEGGAEFMSGTAIRDLPENLTGKTDRAVPHDNELCTVLELNRGTGLKLARPCKMIETAEINGTLGKADLLVKPR